MPACSLCSNSTCWLMSSIIFEFVTKSARWSLSPSSAVGKVSWSGSMRLGMTSMLIFFVVFAKMHTYTGSSSWCTYTSRELCSTVLVLPMTVPLSFMWITSSRKSRASLSTITCVISCCVSRAHLVLGEVLSEADLLVVVHQEAHRAGRREQREEAERAASESRTCHDNYRGLDSARISYWSSCSRFCSMRSFFFCCMIFAIFDFFEGTLSR